MVIVLWATALLFFAPLHGKLASRFEVRTWSLLVRTNWIRTCLWSVRGVLVFFLIP